MNKLTIGQLSKKIGLPPKTIRYYEERGLITPAKRMDNNYRYYSDKETLRLRLIKEARSLELSLAEIKELVDECMDESCEHLREKMLEKLPSYISSIKQRIGELSILKSQLVRLDKNLKTVSLTQPKRKIREKCNCEVIEQMEKGGE